MTQSEKKLFALLKNAHLSKLEVFLKDGKISRIQGTEYHSPQTRLHILSSKNEFQEITLLKEKGQTRKIKRVFKIKL